MFFSLLYCEQPRNGDFHEGLMGPFLYRDRTAAMDEVYRYVRGRIIETAETLFIAAIEDGEIDINLWEYATEHDEPLTDSQLERLFNDMSPSQKEAICDWYFDFAADDAVEAFFKITEHEASFALHA